MPRPQTSVTFSLQFCSITIGGIMLDGFPEGDAMTVAYDGDDFEAQNSSDGFVIYVQKHNNTATVTCRLQQGHAKIALLRQLHDLSVAGGGLMYSFNAVNLKSPDERIAGKFIFKKQPDIKWGDGANPVEFTGSLQPTIFAGGTITPG
jgi:hypothetical protein